MHSSDDGGDRLRDYGFTSFHQENFRAFESEHTLEPARVVFSSREHFRVLAADGERQAHLAGALRHGASGGEADLPAVGDFVAVERSGDSAVIRALLPRRSCLSRKVAGDQTREQVVAANVDTVFLVMGLDGDFNLRRLERFTVLARESGAEAVVLLTKADLALDTFGPRLDAQQAAPGLPVHVVSSLTSTGLEPLDAYLARGQTVALLGSSGAGKSTLINRLAGREVMETGAVREGDDRGRHTTTHRQLVELPSGALLLDNPGVREIQLWAGEEALGEAFEDIEALAKECRFRDCGHGDEPGCAVQQAVSDGRLEASRLENWYGLARELASLEIRRDVATRRREEKRTGKLYKRIQAAKRKRGARF